MFSDAGQQGNTEAKTGQHQGAQPQCGEAKPSRTQDLAKLEAEVEACER